MNRTMVPVAALFSASSLLLDSAVKGAALLWVAAVVAVMLRRDSAATRHLVWLLAIVAMLVLPVLSAILPQWRVLPEWARIVPEPVVVSASLAPTDAPEIATVEVPRPANPVAVELPSAPVFPPARELPAGPPARMTPEPVPAPVPAPGPVPAPPTRNWTWHAVLPLVWAIGFCLLVLRLVAARFALWNTERQATVIRSSGRSAPATQDRLVTALELSRLHLGIRRPVRLLVHSEKTIPVVWGIVRPRLLLPTTARHWTDEQLRSVLLHELAHIKRRDIVAQLLAQMACALHWFNPLVWLAAWRLGVERERACDDLVLASGVRASAYAGHLLDVVAGHSPARWTQTCGLTMARQSSLEGRLVAVLNQNLSRRRVTSAVAAAALALGTAVAIPVSMLHSAGETTTKEPVAKRPLEPSAYRGMDAALLNRWQALEGNAGSIPETRLAGLRSAIGRFIAGIDASPYSLTPEQATALKALQARDADQPEHTADAAERFVKAVFAIHGEPVQMAFNEAAWPGTTRPVDELERLPFGPAAPNGLRAALSSGKDHFVFGDTARLDLHLWNTGSQALVVGIGRDAPGLYPKLDLIASGRDRRRIEAAAGREPQMLADIKFTKTWQLRPGESAQIFGYLLQVGTGAPREAASWPKWYSTIEIQDVRSGEEVTLSASLPYPSAPGAPPVAAALQTGKLKITATSPDDVANWVASGAGRWPMPGGVTLEVKQECFHAADVQTSAILTWPQDAAGVTHAHTIGLAADYFGNRDPWHLVWEKDATVLWAMSGQIQSWSDRERTLPTPVSVTRIDFSDKMKITRTTWGHQPEAMPEGVRAAFLSAFRPLPASPRNPADANGSVTIEQAHDVRPIAELLNGVWKNRDGRIDVRLAFPDHESGSVKWTIDFNRHIGDSIANADLRRINSPAENAVRLWMPSNPAGFVDEQDILGKLRRGPGNTLLLDIHQRAKFPGHEAATGIVLVRDSAGAPVGTDAGARTATGPPAAQPPQFPPPSRDAVRGLDLSRAAVRRSSEALAHTPDLYIPDPENPGSWTQPKTVFQMPLAEHTWLKYPAGSGHFYIEHRPDGTWQNEQLYGPIHGDPFEVLELEALLREQLQPGANSGDPHYRLRLMFRTGDSALIRRAVRLIEPELARRFERGAAGLFHYVELLEIAREALRDEAAAFRNPELSDDAVRLRQSLAAAETAIDRINDSVPDSGYQSVTYLQPKLKAKIPDSLWGRPVDGLRLALVPREWTPEIDWNELPLDTPMSASLTVRSGHEQRYQLLVENVSDHEIKLSGYVIGEEMQRSLEVLDQNGNPVETQSLHTTIMHLRSYWRLEPGERQLLSMPAVHFVPGTLDASNQGLGYTVKISPGGYMLRCSIRFGHYDNTRHRHDPGQSEWIGELTTGSQQIAVVDADADSTEGFAKSDDGKSSAEDVRLDPSPGSNAPGRAPQESQEPHGGEKLSPDTERKLEWGEPVNGLRMALAWPPALGEPAGGAVSDFYLVVQNASQAPVRLDAPDERWLDLKDKDGILFRLRSKEPTSADGTLEPREAIFVRLFGEAATQPDAFLAGAGIASSVSQTPDYRLRATLKVARAPAGAWTGTLTTPDTRAGLGAEAPKNRKAQELLKVWLSRARLSGKIPGGFIARLGEHVKAFVNANAAEPAGAPFANRMKPLLSRLDGTRDWQPVEAATLLNDIAAVSDAPLTVMLAEIAGGKVQRGLPFKPELEKAPWGEPVGHGIGLRTATLIGPGIESKLHYVDWIGNVVTEGRAHSDEAGLDASGSAIRLGTPLGCRLLIHNAGQEPVVFRTRTWHHIEPTAKNAQGAEIGMESVTRLTRAPLVTFRVDPGRYIELAGPGFGLGKYGFHDFKNADIATWIGAKEGDDVTVTPGALPLNDWNEVEVLGGEPRWWLDFITARLNLVAPLPAAPAERKELLNKAMSDLFRQDVRPTEAETAAFLSDNSPEALTNLAMRLHRRTGVRAWAGPVESGPTRFRVLPADPAAPKPSDGPAATLSPASPAGDDKQAAAPAGQTPEGKEAQALFKVWQNGARTNGNIPGGALGSLTRAAENFVKFNPTDERAPKIAELLKRIDLSRDWTPAEAVALLDEVTAVYASLPSWAQDELRFTLGGAVQTGGPLPAELNSAPWGEAQPNGLRTAWMLEPRATEHRLGSSLKSRILFHNAGKNVVLFRALTWNQSGAHKAQDATGAEIKVTSTRWTTIPRIIACRLAPGEYLEVTAAGIGVGARGSSEGGQNIRVGSWVEAKPGDEVTFTPAPVALNGRRDEVRSDGDPGWWLEFVRDRLSRDMPLPADAAERRHLLDRAVRDLFGTPPTPEETAAFVSDPSPEAFDALANRLAERAGTSSFTGALPSGATRFRVLPAGSDAAKKPRTANSPSEPSRPSPQHP